VWLSGEKEGRKEWSVLTREMNRKSRGQFKKGQRRKEGEERAERKGQ